MQHPNRVIFESISEIPQWLSEQSVQVAQGSQMRASQSWDMGEGYEGVVAMAEDGGFWEEGAAHMIEATSAMTELKRDGYTVETDYDVTGAYLDMDEYLSGSPECFVSQNEEVPVSVIKIGVQLYTPGGNDFSEYLNRGAAIMSVIDDLEMQGVRVELWGCVSGVNRRSQKGNITGIDMRVCLKQAHEAWSPSSVAFGLCHAGFGRRLGFRVAESFENNDDYCCGHTLDFKKDRPLDSDFDCWLGYNDMVENEYRDVAQALSMIQKEIALQLKEGEGTGYAAYN